MIIHANELQTAAHHDVCLSWAFDDETDPTEVTIFDSERELTTHWITIDKDHVCNLVDNV